MAEKKCPKCKRLVTVVPDDLAHGEVPSNTCDGKLCTHGPGPKGEFICPGSGDKAMVKAAKHLKV